MSVSASSSPGAGELEIRYMGLIDYQTSWQAMREFTKNRVTEVRDELWLLEHPPVFTQGQAGKSEHLLAPGDIQVVNTDRGGQVTYHGPGQLVGYVLLDLRRLGLGVRALVELLEAVIVSYLAENDIEASGRRDAPGVYVDGAKVAALGLRVSRGCSYHGFSLNVNNDLSPFERINPCGFANLPVTSLSELGIKADCVSVGDRLASLLSSELAAFVRAGKH